MLPAMLPAHAATEAPAGDALDGPAPTAMATEGAPPLPAAVSALWAAEQRCLGEALAQADRDLGFARAAVAELAAERAGAKPSLDVTHGKAQAQLAELRLQVARLQLERDESVMICRQMQAVHRAASGRAALRPAQPPPPPGVASC